MKRISLLLLSFALIVSSFQANLVASTQAQSIESLPAPIPGAILPTIQVSPTHGLPGAILDVSGSGVSPYPGVRLVWLDDETSATLQVVDLDNNDNYSASIRIPESVAPGSGRVCAAVTGTDQAAFECVNVVVDTPPPGELAGTMPVSNQSAGSEPNSPSAFDAVLNLYDQQGNIVASAPIQSNGSYAINNAPPGTYTAGVAGSVPVVVQNATVVIQSGQQAIFNPVPYADCTKGSVVGIRLTPTGKATSLFDFGSYYNYWPYTEAGPKLDFQVDMQVLNGATLGLMAVYHDREDDDDYLFAAVDAPDQGTTYEFSDWVADVDIGIRTFSFEPIISYSTPGCQVEFGTTRVHIIEHPMQSNGLQQYVDRRVNDLVWDGSRYVFDVRLHSSYDGYDLLLPFFSIDGEKKLPVTFPEPFAVLDYIGAQENIIGGAAYNAGGTIDLDGNVTIQMLRTKTRSSPMNFDSLVNGFAPFLPEGSGIPLGTNASRQYAGIPLYLPQDVGTDLVEKLRQVHYDIPPTTLFEFHESIPVFEGAVFSIAGIVTVKVSVYLGIGGDMLYQGTIKPLAPAVSALATANVRPSVDVSVIADVLGVADIGGTGHTEAEIRFPIQMDSDDSRFIWMQDPCFRLHGSYTLWVRANLLFASATWSTDPKELFDYREGACQTLDGQDESLHAPFQDPPRLLAAPGLSSGPGGRMLAVYIEDSAPDNAIPAPKVMARFWDIANEEWGPATALTDGTHMVQNPQAAFYGTEGRAMVVWTENPITQAEEEAAIADINAIVRRQEIYYATYNGSQWSAPIRLTNDLLSDGHAALAGDDLGITLAWMQDGDGDLTTSLDWRIAVREWNPSNSIWTDLVLLNGSLSDAANYQVSVDRQVVSAVSQRALAWTFDADGDQTTTSDRHIEVFDWNGAEWERDTSTYLPSRAESARIAYLPDGQELVMTFLVRNNDAGGSSGGIGNHSALWTARRIFGGNWSDYPVMDELGEAVYAEQPRVDVSSDGEALVLFRRFGEVATNGEIGQIAYSQIMDTGETYPPIYVTDEAREHWQPALAINQSTAQAVFLNIGRSLSAGNQAILMESPLKAASPGTHPILETVQLSPAEDTLDSAIIEPGADPALDPILDVSQFHADPGTTITVTATVRNIGRGLAGGVKVGLYAGEAPGGSLVEEITVGDLDFNHSHEVEFLVAASTGSQPMYAKITASSANIDTTNDLANISIGELLSPEMVYLQPHPSEGEALQLAWQAPAIQGIGGYRILRSLISGGPYELVGETSRTIFTDYLLSSGVQYYYVLQTFDEAGAVSIFSAEVTGVAVSSINMIFMPIVGK
jgi:hypothetical protein